MNFAAKAVLASLIAAAPLSGALAQAPAAAPAAPMAPPVIANPVYATLVLEVAIAKPAAQVWARVGKYCDIQEWSGMTCQITAGKAGDLGSVRTLNGSNIEMLVGKTDLSYTYAQPVRVGVPYNAYHGTLEAKPVTATTSKIMVSFFYDESMLGDEAARAASKASRATRWNGYLQKIKALAEAG